STGLVTCDSNSAGAAPNWVIVTDMTGTSTFGRRVMGSLLKPTQPRNMMTIAPTIDGRGDLIDHAEIFNAIHGSPPARTAKTKLRQRCAWQQAPVTRARLCAQAIATAAATAPARTKQLTFRHFNDRANCRAAKCVRAASRRGRPHLNLAAKRWMNG